MRRGSDGTELPGSVADQDIVDLDALEMRGALPSERKLGAARGKKDILDSIPFSSESSPLIAGGAFLCGEDVRARHPQLIAKPGESLNDDTLTEGTHAAQLSELGQVAVEFQHNDAREKGVGNNVNTVLEEVNRTPRAAECWRTHGAAHDPLDAMPPPAVNKE